MSIAPVSGFGTAKWIVSATAGQGTHTTIAAALTAASSGDTIFIRPGTYTENPTLKAGVNLTAYTGDAQTPNVIINGKCTFTAAGTVTLSGIQLQTNSDFCLAVTGSAASVVNLIDCFINGSNNTAISFTSSNSSSQVNLYNSTFALGTTGIAFWSCSSAGSMALNDCLANNSGASTTASTTSSTAITMYFTYIAGPLSTSSTGTYGIYNSFIATSATNSVCLTTAGTGSSVLQQCNITSGTASSLSAGAGTTISCFNSNITSSNANAVTGAGTFTYGGIVFATTATINTTTKNPVAFSVPQGGTGNTSATAYAVQCGGTTSTSAFQSVSGVGTSGQVLTSNGAAALPTWQSGASVQAITTVNHAASPYTVLSTDEFLAVNTSGGVVTIKLPNAPTTGRVITIKDSNGTANTSNISVTTVGGAVTIDGSTTYTMNVNYQSISVIFDGTNYEVF